jgi:hypothetical protein
VTVDEIVSRVIKRIDDDPVTPISVSIAEVLAAVNQGQQLAALLTLCLEKTVSFALTTSTFYTPRSTVTDLIVPLRLAVSGVRLRPSTLAELDAMDPAWQATAGTPSRYFASGCNLFGVTPQGTATAQLTYAASPATMISGNTPAIPATHHPDLVEYGVYRVRLKEGAQQLARGLGNLNVFLDGMTKLGQLVKARSLAARYYCQPFELALFDRSALIDEILKWQAKSTPKH